MISKLIVLFLSFILVMMSFENIYAESNTNKLLPTDDTYITVDLLNPNHPVSDLNTGDETWIKIWYSFDVVEADSHIVSFGHLKFDLSKINTDDITSATLNMNSFDTTIIDNTVSVYKADSSVWDESSLTYKTKPTFNPTPIDTANRLAPTNWMQWDVTNAIKQNNSADITFVIAIDELKLNSEEGINFYSKESLVLETYPFLELTFGVPSEQTPNDYLIKKLPVIEDAYVGANYVSLQGFEEMRNTNTGNYNFTKIWYNYNATGAGELFVSSGFLKFDLSELNPANVIGAQLKMYDNLVETSGADRIISVFLVDNSTWSETELTFDNKPELGKEISVAQIDVVNDWISWDVTDAVKESTNSELTLSISYDQFMQGHEEVTVFNSKEALENTPYLEVVYDEEKAEEKAEGGGCLIATATYGSEMAPQVQMLREIRDNSLLQTQSGKSFMQGFNEFYYSFSPAVADYERQNPVFKEAVRLLITPLISSLSILNHADLDSESSVLGYGLSIIALNVGIYFVSPVVGLKIVKKLLSKKKKDP